ncbi:NAD-dependent epimerase/dehydratase family protein [Polynucleobacter sp. HIN6]|uniref:NAD-dependent epimerase/dehydratase family protein n=1 Tax=Polynucleobacter sp. HIN6 TaxID=3047865 RepID=UPI00257328CE|nr:NAD-dependent epimerase/dehydratase family protein [Polynucleobacter sp. HIN6]BEI34786.1 NAD-dependent epimerase/dehydratase family protein [Polynucleobacter sp. HIN6]
MKIVIFGGGGFIGSAIADRLLLDGHELRIFERPRVEPYRTFSPDESVEWIAGDFMSSFDVGNAIDGMDVVLHLVSTTLPKSSNEDPIFDVQTNLIGTLQMLNAMVDKRVQKIVFISSGGTVYGNPSYLPINESHSTNPVVSYGISKLAIEKYLLLYQHLYGINSTVLRVSNPFGERQRIETAQGAVGVFLYKAIIGQPIDIWGDGSVVRDYIYVTDVAEAFAKAIYYHGTESIFNIGSGIGTSLNQLIGLIEDSLDLIITKNYLPSRAYDVKANILDNSLAFKELGWSPAFDLNVALKNTAQWIRSQLAC